MQRQPLSPSLKGFLIDMIKGSMYDAGYTPEEVLRHVSEVEPIMSDMKTDELTAELLEFISDDMFHHC